MTIHFTLNPCWLLLPLALGLLWWALHERESERATSFAPNLSGLFRLWIAVTIFLVAALGLALLTLWLQ